MKEEFNLSDKRLAPHKNSETQFKPFYFEDDVKEFIQRLKEERPMQYSFDEWVDKLVGEKLK